MQKVVNKFLLKGLECGSMLTVLFARSSCKHQHREYSIRVKDIKKRISAVNTTTTPYVCVGLTSNGSTHPRRIEVYRFDTTWTTATCLWSFQPSTALGFDPTGVSIAINGGGFPVDQKVHYVDTEAFRNTQSAVVTAGHRWVGILRHQNTDGTYPSPTKLWEVWYQSNPNIHAVELLPNGNVVVASPGNSSTGAPSWIRVYNTSYPAVRGDYAEFNEIEIQAAHTLHWDPVNNILWAGAATTIDGQSYHGLFAFTIGGTRINPTINEVVSRRSVKPYGTDPDGLKWPHDVSPYYGDNNKLWYSDHSGVYIYDKIAKTFTLVPGDAQRYVGASVKAAGNQAGGKVLIAEALNPSGTNTYPCKYTNNKVDFYDEVTGNLSFSRSVSNCYIYRARV